MKIFAYYLPQFHCIPENDLWWGKGFTEWTNVKKAKSLYKGHIQPKHPLNDNYYSLDNIETLKWQRNLMKNYNIDGLIFYHYYFTGKKLLEKPAEMLLSNKDIDFDFFFCWANHSWFRSWEGSKTLLMEQKYGSEKEWEEHFEYLLPFFKDSRYQKKDNKPILMIFNPDFEEKADMFEYFDKKCKENGFDGICLVETVGTYNKKVISEVKKQKHNYTRYIQLREPTAAVSAYISKVVNYPERLMNKMKLVLNKIFHFKFVRIHNGDKLFKVMSDYKFDDKDIIRSLFFEWDNTPRHSYSDRASVITAPSKESFIKYMENVKDDEFLFINAWNEWAEGMILEPTEENQYKYLEWIKEWRQKNEI